MNREKHDVRARWKQARRRQQRTGNNNPPPHPVFTPNSVHTRAPLLEMDYNMHKSNSTYFSDLDVSRTPLVTDLYCPGLEIIRRELEGVSAPAPTSDHKGNGGSGKKKKTAYPGGIYVILGSVYCSFKRPIRAYEAYETQSKVVGWDEKWLYVVTYFLRKKGGKGGKGAKQLLAVGISEYVAKKGRFTISPSRILNASGLLPDAPDVPGDVIANNPAVAEAATSATATTTATSISTSTSTSTPGGAAAAAAATATTSATETHLHERKSEPTNDETTTTPVPDRPDTAWTWEAIEAERQRGMQLVQQFVGLEAGLVAEANLD